MFPKHITRCPVCGGNHYEYESLREDMMVIEQNGSCEDCGYFMESDYSFPFEGFIDCKRGWRDKDGKYHPKNVRKHKRNRRKHLDEVKKIVKQYW
jgi:hypothetical protein